MPAATSSLSLEGEDQKCLQDTLMHTDRKQTLGSQAWGKGGLRGSQSGETKFPGVMDMYLLS